VAFGPHGPRTPTSLPGDGRKILLAVIGLLGASAVLHQVIRSFCTPFTLLFIVLLTLFMVELALIRSTTTKVYVQGMARGYKRACHRAETQSYHRCVFRNSNSLGYFCSPIPAYPDYQALTAFPIPLSLFFISGSFWWLQ